MQACAADGRRTRGKGRHPSILREAFSIGSIQLIVAENRAWTPLKPRKSESEGRRWHLTRVSVSVLDPMVGFRRDIADCGIESMSTPIAVCKIGRFGM